MKNIDKKHKNIMKKFYKYVKIYKERSGIGEGTCEH